MKRSKHPLAAAALVATLTAPAVAHAERCSRAQIDHYLDLGYSLARITRLCADEQEPAQDENPAPQTRVDPATAVYLETAIDADKVEIDNDEIRLIQDRCFPYGEEGYSGIRPSACVTRTVTIRRQGMAIGDVVEARFLIRDGKLIVQGDIRQHFSRTEKLRKRELAGLKQQYPEKLDEFDVPVKPAMKRKKVAEALKKLVK